ncbi:MULTISPECIES: hypothetical protein [Clostridium]|nr:hypothetical protein [Clostridium botulinum]MBD5639473.1 hypothetical protein [Clostridium botulinum]NFI74672.1 hypothetical protein [Clostridium sporogenes]NFU95850.1 hypothetical protein [Clostridium sporogenes]WMU99801.1 hypothetical protein QA656_19400 [Clostridium botulinum]
MVDIMKFMQKLIEDMNDIGWMIEKIVDGKKVVKNDDNYLEIDGELYDEQDDFYIKQWTDSCGDGYYGVIFYPLENNKYLKINYSC